MASARADAFYDEYKYANHYLAETTTLGKLNSSDLPMPALPPIKVIGTHLHIQGDQCPYLDWFSWSTGEIPDDALCD